MHRRCLPIILLALAGPLPAVAQPVLELDAANTGNDLVVNGAIPGGAEVIPVFQAIWRSVPGGSPSFQWQHTGAPRTDVRLMLDRLLETAIAAQLDHRIHFTKQGVTADLPADVLAVELDGLVAAACAGLGVAHPPPELSGPTRRQLDRLTRIDWSQARFGIDGGEEQDKYLAIYFYVRSQRDELQRQIRADLLPLAEVPVVGPGEVHPGTTVRINSTCGTVFDEENFLCALDLQLADTGSGGIDPKLSDSILRTMEDRAMAPPAAVVADEMRIRKRDRWLKEEFERINQRIDRMDQRKELWELRDRMDDLEGRMTDMGMEVQELKAQRTVPSENPIADLSELTRTNITIRFDRYSTAITPEYHLLLNEVFEQLARAPEQRVLITGYSDRSGDPATNLRLSEQRARAVRNYLLQRGIGPDRLLVNHYGDSRSAGRNPDERRVEVEWLR